jgi:signal transduction histidine kinase
MPATIALALGLVAAALAAARFVPWAARALAAAAAALAATWLAPLVGGPPLGASLESFALRHLGVPPSGADLTASAAAAVLLLALSLAPMPRLPDVRIALGAFAGLLGMVSGLLDVAGVHTTAGPGAAFSMPPSVALLLVTLGAGTVVLARADALRGEPPAAVAESWRDPLLLGFLAFGATLALAIALGSDGEARLRAATEVAAERFRALLAANIESRIRALSFHALEWEVRGRPNEESVERNVALLTDVTPSLRALEWIDAEGKRRWSFPQSAPPVLPQAAVQAKQELAPALDEARATRTPVVSGLVQIGDHGTGFRIFVPVFLLGAKPDGFLAAVFDADADLAPQLATLAPDYGLVVEADGIEIYRRGNPDDEAAVPIDLALPGGARWQLRVAPTGPLRPSGWAAIPWLTFTSGAAIAVLLALVLRFAQQASARAGALAEANVELEERVRARTADLARSNEDLRQFASFVAHELRQPLGTMEIWLELLETGAKDELDDKHMGYVRQIRMASRRLADLVAAQLKLAAIASQSLDEGRVDLATVIRQVTAELALDISAAGAKVEVGRLPVVRADARQMLQLFQNLISNALKYRRPEQPPVVRVREEPSPPAGRTCVVVVEDNGRGFDPGDAERIFRMFQRLEPGAAEGSGLGLAICRRIVARNGGTIEASGRPGEGAAFRVTLLRA